MYVFLQLLLQLFKGTLKVHNMINYNNSSKIYGLKISHWTKDNDYWSVGKRYILITLWNIPKAAIIMSDYLQNVKLIISMTVFLRFVSGIPSPRGFIHIKWNIK